MDKSFYFALPLDEEAHRAMYGLENYLSDNQHPNAETVDFDCAIIVFPNDKQLHDHRELMQEDFDDDVQGNQSYHEMVKEMIESVGVKNISTRADFLRLVGISETWNLTLRKDQLPPWNLIFFTCDHGPKIIPPADLAMETITQYFKVRPR